MDAIHYTLPEAARLLGMHPQRLRRAIHAHEVPGLHTGKYILVPVEFVERVLHPPANAVDSLLARLAAQYQTQEPAP